MRSRSNPIRCLRNHLSLPKNTLPKFKLPKATRTAPGRGLLVLTACWLAITTFASPQNLFAVEADWKSAKLPIKPADVDGFTATVEVLNPASEGYMPIRITATSVVGTFPGDRPIEISVVPKYGATPKPNTTYRTSLTLPAGSVSISKTFYLPKYFEGGVFNVVLGDSNGPLKSYVASFNVRTSITSQAPDMLLAVSDWLTRFAIILPDPNAAVDQPWARVPDLRTLESMVSVDANYVSNPKRQTDAEAKTYIEVQAKAASQLLTANTAHQSWLGYESIDVILIAMPTLQSMAENHPLRFKAVRDWVSCGGVLWTYAVPDRTTLADLFGVSSDQAMNPSPAQRSSLFRSASSDPIDKALANYTPSNRTTSFEVVLDPYNYSNNFGGRQSGASDPIVPFQNAAPNAEQIDPHPFLVQKSPDDYRSEIDRLHVEAGVVIGLKTADPFPGSLEQWFVIKNLSGANQVWRHRRGISVMRGSTQFWDWLMNNVARPPVYAFLALLSGFVLLVGPISYHFTRRAGRGYLMFIIAPVLASITTLMLFGYGFVADGFGTKARVRQITWVDGESGKASEMNRATYFAAFRPSGGLRFPIDAAVYPVLNTDDAIERDYSPVMRFNRSIELTDSEQIFRGEFLPSRTQSQFFSFRPLDKNVGLLVEYEKGLWRVKNQFDASLNRAIIRMTDATYCMLPEPLGPGESVLLSSTADSKAMIAMREMYRDDQPLPPLGYAPGGTRSNNWYQLSTAQAVLTSLTPSWSNSGDDLGLYEARLRDYLSDKNQLPNHWFVGTLDVSNDASAVSGAQILESVHYVMGTIRVQGETPAPIMSTESSDRDESDGDENEQSVDVQPASEPTEAGGVNDE